MIHGMSSVRCFRAGPLACLLSAIALVAAPAAEPVAFRSGNRSSSRCGMARDLVGGVLAIQLQQLHENGLDALSPSTPRSRSCKNISTCWSTPR